ncbi:MAG TPA: radical SAM protein, partial [Clostridiaceae bacterium]|nr:radical SAM protein [Clostridiaceae bacterium]
MKLGSLMRLSYRGMTTILFHKEDPLVGSIILTDRCNLSCRHCAVNNITGRIYPYVQVRSDMETLYREGVRVLLLYGGEPFLWTDQGLILRDLVREAKRMGFLVVSIVTNGTFPLDVPEADLILVSLDGGKENHDLIRGETYDRIMENIRKAKDARICLYMAINQVNREDIGTVCRTAVQEKNVKAVSFNFHTPYPGTGYLSLSREEKMDCAKRITGLIEEGYPILNLKKALPYIAANDFRTPCPQCVVMENGQEWVCGRCIEIEGLCEECGYFFAAEFSLLFGGNWSVV